MRAPRPAGRRPRVLSVGCGIGDVDEAVAWSLLADVEGLDYVGLDPNRVECAAFLQALAAIPRVDAEVEVTTFEEFESSARFDLIHFVHSLYYMADPAAALRRARSMLAPGGQLVVVQAPREELNDLSIRFYDKCYDRPTLFAADIAAELERQEWRFEKQRVQARIDVSGLQDDDRREVGDLLRDFIVQVDVQQLPAEVRELVEDYLQQILFEVDGRRFIAHPADVFFLDA